MPRPPAKATPRPDRAQPGLTPRAAVLGLALVVSLAAPAAAQTPSFTLIGVPSGLTSSRLYGLSADGRVAAGWSGGVAGNYPGHIWSLDAGRYDFGREAGLPWRTMAYAISGDGSTVVGDSQTTNTAPSQAYRWSGTGTFQTLSLLPQAVESHATGVSGDGSIIVGYQLNAVSPFGSARAVRWTSPSTAEFLEPQSTRRSSARGISRDGTTIVGEVGVGTTDAFTWTQGGGLQILPWRPGALSGAHANAVNFDGSVVVGESDGHTVIWRNGQVQDLGSSPLHHEFWPDAVNDAGTVVTGISFEGPGGGTASIWTPDRGIEYLTDFLAFHGVTVPSGWTLFECTAVSADGMTFAGWTNVHDGQNQGFVATIPSPASASLGLVALGLAVRRRR